MAPPSVLIVDDSEVIRVVLASRLEAHGAEVVCARSTRDALAVDTARITTAIVDVDLDGEDGVSLADVLLGKNPSMRLALFSASAGAPVGRLVFRKPEQIDHVIAWVFEAS